MPKYEVTFLDHFEADKVEDIYEWLLTYMEECVRNEDVEGFNFRLINEEEENAEQTQKT
tara:strand:- start:18874 stop:19050 length:177 start_codon:yes stop_codon:yes gene_type:complete